MSKQDKTVEVRDPAEETSPNPRRRLLHALAAGGLVSALPGEWVRPVVEQIVLPAHGKVSECEDLTDDDDTCCPDDIDDCDFGP